MGSKRWRQKNIFCRHRFIFYVYISRENINCKEYDGNGNLLLGILHCCNTGNGKGCTQQPRYREDPCLAILVNYGIAQKYGGKFNMRFDDTNPTKEDIEFVER